jgi:pyrroloquinoline quinone biosynthesis protein B
VIVRVLGSAAGGGVPQWNCACRNCAAARAGKQPRRTQSGFAVSADGERWLLVNCSPDIAAQIEAFPPLQPRAVRGTPIDGMLLTDANVDHIGGLAVLRQSGNHRFIVRSSAVVREIAVAQPAFAPFAALPHRWLSVAFDAPLEAADDPDIIGTALTVEAFALPGTTPGFDGRRRIEGAVVGFRIAARGSDDAVVFAPVYAGITERLREAVATSRVAFLDGSFFSDDEMQSKHLVDKHATALGHLPVGGENGTLATLGISGTRCILSHVNNSNPLLDPSSTAFQQARAAGVEVAYDGMEVVL